MEYAAFITEIQHRIDVTEQGEAIRAIRAVLTPLGERIQPEEANNLAEHLPMEIDQFLLDADSGQKFSYREFVNRVADYEHEDAPEANYDAQVFIAYLTEFVPSDVIQRVRDDLPSEFSTLFEVADREAQTEE